MHQLTSSVIASPVGNAQEPFTLPSLAQLGGHPAHPPRIDYAALGETDSPLSRHLLRFDEQDEDLEQLNESRPPIEGMELVKLHESGPTDKRVNLVFMADGCESSPGTDHHARC
jgi:hypothetical protein